MPVVLVVRGSTPFTSALRRGLRRRRLRVARCRSADGLGRALESDLVDAIVFGVRKEDLDRTLELIHRYPRIPVFACGRFRPNDGELLLCCRQNGVRDILLDDVDEAVAAELVASRTATMVRYQSLKDAPRLLRLSEPLQIQAWREVVFRVDGRLTTRELARALKVTREHLSREFAAGGAPNLKRVIDLARVLCATDLLSNPAYSLATVARVLKYSSPSHFAGCVRRIAGTAPRELPDLGLSGVLARFVKGRTRSRLGMFQI